MKARSHIAQLLVLALVAAGLNAVPLSSGPVGRRPQAPAPAPNRFDPATATASVSHPVPAPGAGGGSGSPPPAAPTVDLPKTTLSLDLSSGNAARVLGDGGRLEVDVPAGAVSAEDLLANGGGSRLRVTQTAGPAGASAGGSGHLLFGSYLLQVTDGRGRPAARGLRRPVTLRLPAGPSAGPIGAAGVRVLTRAVGGGGAAGATVDSPAVRDVGGTLSATVDAASAATAVTFAATAPVSVFGTANTFSADVSTGSLTAHYPIQVPSGPGGLAPPLSLDYNSALVAEQHNPVAAAGWVGEGWDLSLGEITWSENLTAQYWANTWHIQDPFGLADELVPPTVNTSTYYDDRNGTSITAEPIRWHTATESHAKIYSYTGPVSLPGMSTPPPCFRVFLPNGVMEEYGCTADSLRYYPSGSRYFVSGWLLDLVTDRDGNQIHVTYQRDMATGGDSGTMSYPRDSVLSTVEWDSPGCVGSTAAQAACTGTGTAPNAWTPLMRVSFTAAHAVTRFTGTPAVSNKNGCNTLPMRCDDPSVDPPLQQSTFVLNDALVQVRGSGTAAWQTLRDYQFSYEQTGTTSFQDPWTGQNAQGAGKLNLTALRVVGDDGSTAEPTRTFTYTSVTQYYTDLDFGANPGPQVDFPWYGGISVTQRNCGPSWNYTATTAIYWVYDVNGTPWTVYDCPLWSTSMDGNSSYLASAANGLGLAQTFSWANAYPNVEGVATINGAADVADPLFCDGHESTPPCGTRSVYQEWSRAVLTSQSGAVVRSSSAGNRTVTSTTSYRYRLTTPVPAQPDCNAGGRCFRATMYFRALFHFDPDDFNDAHFMGFAEVDVTDPDGSVEKHHYKTTMGIGVYDDDIPCVGTFCRESPWWAPDNALHGKEYEDDVYDVDGTTLLSRTTTGYALTCPPAGVSPSPSWSDTKDVDSGFPYTFTWDGQLVSELNNVDPVAVCDIQTSQVDTYTWDGAASGTAVPHSTTSYTYDSYGRVTTVTTATNDGGAIGSATGATTQTSYVWNDSVAATATGVTGTYLIDIPAATAVVSADGTRHTSCQFTGYDGQPYTTGQSTQLTRGEATTRDAPSSCGTAANSFTPSGDATTSLVYDQYGNLVGDDDADANAGDPTHRGCTIGADNTPHSVCVVADATFATLPVSARNALGQTAALGYGASTDPAAGFGLWPLTQTDGNAQQSRNTYDALGRPTATTLPGETPGLTTSATTYTSWCSGTAAQSPCLEVDQTRRADDNTTVTSRTFYDGWGNPVETRSPAPGNRDLVTFTYYDPSGRVVFQSVSYFVPAYTGGPGAAAFSAPDAGQAGSSTTYLSRTKQTANDPSSHTTTHATAVACALPDTGDGDCYTTTTTTDPLGHQRASYVDAFGRDIYDRTFTGDATHGYTPYATAQATYDIQGNVATVVLPGGGGTIRYRYDDQGQQIETRDPDQGVQSYSYDPDGNLVRIVDARGVAGTTYLGYDALDRPLWRNTANSATGAYLTYTYDSTDNGNQGVGRLTGESFLGGAGGALSGSHAYTYDARGQLTAQTTTVDGHAYTVRAGYDDAGNVRALTYPSGNVLTDMYTAGTWLTEVSLASGGTQARLLSGASYTGSGGAAGHLTGASLADGGLGFAATYDNLGQLTDSRLSRATDQAVLFEQARTFDAVGDVTAAVTTLPQGTDQQTFCYDDQRRLVWAGSTGTPPCAGGASGTGTLGAAGYTQSFGYDPQGRFTTGPLGAAYFTDRNHTHATTLAGAGYAGSYDASGDQTCRTAGADTTDGCAGTGTQLAYDNEGRLVAAQTAAAVTSGDLYDGEGQRVAQQVTTGGTTSTTVYIGDIAEYTTAGGSTSVTEVYYAGATPVALSANGQPLNYLAVDGLGSPVMAVTAGGTVLAARLYAPYGGVRYASGTMPTDRGYTGQVADTATGLDYHGARFYDPASGQFATPDQVGDGPDRYAYARGNPETLTDPGGTTAGSSGPGPVEEDAEALTDFLIETAKQGKNAWNWAQLTVTAISLILTLASPHNPNMPGGSGSGAVGPRPDARGPSVTSPQQSTSMPDEDDNREPDSAMPPDPKQKKPKLRRERPANDPNGEFRNKNGRRAGRPSGNRLNYVVPEAPPSVYVPPVTTVSTVAGGSSVTNPVQSFNTSAGGQAMDTPWSQPSFTPSWSAPPPPPPAYVPPPPVVTPTFVAPVYTPVYTPAYSAPAYLAPSAFDPFGFLSDVNPWVFAAVAAVAVVAVLVIAAILFWPTVTAVVGTALAAAGGYLGMIFQQPAWGY